MDIPGWSFSSLFKSTYVNHFYIASDDHELRNWHERRCSNGQSKRHLIALQITTGGTSGETQTVGGEIIIDGDIQDTPSRFTVDFRILISLCTSLHPN